MSRNEEVERRHVPRHRLSLPIEAASCVGTTTDISSTGVRFSSSILPEIGTSMDFVITLASMGAPLLLRCVGTVTRVDVRESTVYICAAFENVEFGGNREISH